MKNSEEILYEFINLPADKWNENLSKELNFPLEYIRDLITSKELIWDNLIPLKVKKNEISQIAKHKNEYNVLDRYTIRLENKDQTIMSFICNGKIIIGFDFSGSEMSESYFSHCIFYNCNFSNCNLDGSLFASCTFNSCDINKVDLTNSSISKTKFIECNMESVVFDYSVFSDNAIMTCALDNSSFIQSKILYTGFIYTTGNNTDWKDVDFIQSSFNKVSLKNSNFKRSKMADMILIRSDLSNCNFDNSLIAAVTENECIYDKKYEQIFISEENLNVPHVNEWNEKI